MSFGLGHGKPLDDARGIVGISREELPTLPDDAMTNPEAARLDPRQWFDQPERPFELEIGSGKGTFLVQQAGLEPDTNFLGIEWAREFYLYAADRIRRHRDQGTLANIRLLCGDATEFLRWRCPSDICEVVHLYFSDPWPKTKHHKKRVIQDHTLAQFWRVLKPGGELRVVTDHDELWKWDCEHFDRWCSDQGETPGFTGPRPAFERTDFDRPESAGEGEFVGTNFERKFRKEGRSFHAVTLRKLV